MDDLLGGGSGGNTGSGYGSNTNTGTGSGSGSSYGAPSSRYATLCHHFLQGDTSGCSLDLVDIKTEVELKYQLVLLKYNFCFDVN